MELTIEQQQNIIKAIGKGHRNRSVILYETIKDPKVLKVLELYKKRLDSYEISKQTLIKYSEVNEIIKYIDDTTRFIDTQIVRYNLKKIKDAGKEEERAYLRKMNKEDKMKLSLRKYREKYHGENIDKESLKKDIDKITEIVKNLGTKCDDMAFLVQVLLELDMIQMAELTINEAEYGRDLSKYEKSVFDICKKNVAQARIGKRIRNMYKVGLSYDEITRYLENKLTGEDRRIVDRKFISDIFKKCQNEKAKKKELDNQKQNESEKEER